MLPRSPSTPTAPDLATADPVQPPTIPHGEQPDSPPPGGGAWAWVPGTGWVPREA